MNESGIISRSGSLRRNMESACLQLIDSAEEDVHRSFNNYTFLTLDLRMTRINVFAASKEQNLTTFSNNPQFAPLYPHPLPSNAPRAEEIAANPAQQTYVGA